jgi:hypothetical protein
MFARQRSSEETASLSRFCNMLAAMERQLGLAPRPLAIIAIIALAGCGGRTSMGAGRSSGATDARFDQDNTSRDSAPVSGAAAVAAFTHALGTAYRCFWKDITDEAAWADQFENTDQACVARLVQESEELAQCTLRGSAEVEACLVESGCARTANCDTALLTEDTPLIELVERYCPESVALAYWERLRASHFCES